jgi:hypothetical protein
MALVSGWRGAFLAGLAVAACALPVRAQAPQDDFPRDQLLRTLRTGTEVAKQEAIDYLEGRADDSRVADLLLEALDARRLNATVSDSTLRALMLLGTFTKHAKVPEFMTELLGSGNWKVVMVAVDTLGAIGDPKAIDPLAALLASPNYERIYGFRKCLLMALMNIKDPRAMRILVEQVPKLDGQLQFDVVQYLSHVSRQRFATKGDLWATWWADNAGDFHYNETDKPFAPQAGVPPDFAWDRPVADFFGMYIYAKRLVFVIDVSSSMRQGAGGGTRVDMAKKELIEAVEKLPEDTYFTMIMFNTRIAPWRRDLAQAKPEIRQAAVEWVKRIETNVGTASFDALDRAFNTDGNTEAMFFLSDGQPSRGRIKEPNAILKEVKKENLFRRVAIYSFGFAGAGGEQFMRSLAEDNGGVYHPIQ